MVQRTVAVIGILSRRGGGAIFSSIDTEGNKFNVIAPYKSIANPPEKGETWTVKGEFKLHPQHGEQLHAKELWRDMPSGRFLVNFLTRSPDFRNIGLGEKKVNDLWHDFREDLIDHLETGDPEALVPTIKISVAQALMDRWHLFSAESKVVAWLTKLNLDYRTSGTIMRIWGQRALKLLKEDPYRMLIFMGWARVDKAAQQMGVEKDDRRRLIGAVESALYSRVDRSHTLTSRPKLLAAVRKNLGWNCDAPKAVEAAVEAGVAVGDPVGGYQLRGIARLERKIRERMESMLQSDKGSASSMFSTRLIDQKMIDGQIAALEAEQGFGLNDEQRAAVNMVAQHPLCAVCGGAGTGKTTVLAGVHKVFEKAGAPVYQMALSGRAAQRMRESTKRQAFTIAGFIAQAKSGKLDITDNALVVVDESSMLDLPTTYRLLNYLPEGARLLLVGDPYQLPPIGFGLVFDVVVDSDAVPTVELKSVHRQSEASGIPSVALAVRNQIIPELLEYNAGLMHGVSFIDCDTDDIPFACWEVFTNFVDSGIDPYAIRALSPLKRRGSGAVYLNEVFQKRFKPDRKMCGDIRFEYGVGDPIIHLENDYKADLYNGSLGIIEHVVERGEGNIVRALWDDGEVRDIDEVDIYKIGLSYAMTIHKAQGSQFSRVVIPVEASRLLDNSMIYTALTRGVDQVVFIGDRSAFEEAVEAPPRSKTREVGFSLSAGHIVL